MARLSREELFHVLERRIEDPASAAAVEQEVWSRCGSELAIFVSDLSGFTRLTRKHGILHFLTVYRRSSNLGMPILGGRGGRCVKREADNLIYVFDRVSDAVTAAREFVAATASLDEKLPEDERVYPCIAIGFGRVIELSDDVFGDEVNVAFKLGEDIAKKREILLSEGALVQVKREGMEVATEAREDDLGGVAVSYHRLT